MEQQQQHLEIAPSLSWDERFNAIPFSKISSNEWYGPVTDADSVDRTQAKQEFLRDKTLDEPNIHYPKLDDEYVFHGTEKLLQELLDTAPTDAQAVKAARRLAELYRHREVIRLTHLRHAMGQAVFKRELSRERAGVMAAEIFGEPDRDNYLSLVARLRDQATQLQADMPEAAELLSLLGDTKPDVMYESAELEGEAIDVLHEDLEAIFPGLSEIAALEKDGDDSLTPDQMRRRFEDLLDFLGLSEKGWRVELIPDSHAAASTDSNTKVITIGGGRAELGATQAVDSSAHEVLGHAYRSEGQVSLSSLAFEEAFAVALGSIISGKPRKGSGEQYYTALGLQYGLDQEGEQRNSRATHEIMWRRAMVIARTKGEALTQDDARDQAYTQVYRTRRGNAIDTRDRSYYEGARVVPQWLNGIAKLPVEERQKILRWVLSGRFDPTNAEQVEQYPLP